MVMLPNNEIICPKNIVFILTYQTGGGIMVYWAACWTFEWKIGSQWSKHSLFPSVLFLARKCFSYCLSTHLNEMVPANV